MGAGHAEAGRQDPMEGHVVGVEGGSVLGFNCGGPLFEIRRQRVLIGAGHSSSGLGGDLALKRAADEETLAHVVQ